MSEYTLMHKNIEVANVSINESGIMTNVNEVFSDEHIPVGIKRIDTNKQVKYDNLSSWWYNRSIPASRLGLEETVRALQVENAQVLLTKSFGLSLSDHYWVKPDGSNLKWENINYFQNKFSEDIGDIIIGLKANEDVHREINLNSPDNTSDGNLPKRWKIIDDKRYLIKGGDMPVYQQPINEVIASMIMERLDIPHTTYDLIWIKDKPFCMCEDMVDIHSELVSAYSMTKTRKVYNHENDYLHYVNICKENGIADIQHYLDMMIVIDYIITNEDRHFNNFGLIRNPDTLEWIGVAPIYDNGNSLRYKSLTENILTDDVVCKPFKKSHGEQISLVTSYDWLEVGRLKGIEEEVQSYLTDPNIRRHISETRSSEICKWLSDKINRIEKTAVFQSKQNAVFIKKSIKSDNSEGNADLSRFIREIPKTEPKETDKQHAKVYEEKADTKKGTGGHNSNLPPL